MIRTNCQVKDHFPGKHIGMQKKEVANKLVSGQMIGMVGYHEICPAFLPLTLCDIKSGLSRGKSLASYKPVTLLIIT